MATGGTPCDATRACGGGHISREQTHAPLSPWPTAKLLQSGYTAIRFILVDKAYGMWKQKYLCREPSCRIYCLPSEQLAPELLRPSKCYNAPGTTKEVRRHATSCDSL